MYKEGIAEFEKEFVISPGNPYTLSFLGNAYARAGRSEEARKVLVQLDEVSKRKYVSANQRVAIYVGLGDKDKAFGWLEKSYADGSINLTDCIKVAPVYDPLRSDPRFADLLRRTNLEP